MLLADMTGINVLIVLLILGYGGVVLLMLIHGKKKIPQVGKPVKRQVPRDRIEDDLPPWDGSVKAEPRK